MSKLFGNETQTSAGWNNGSVVELSETNLRISVAGKSADTDGVICFVDMETSVFVEHRIESANQNKIVFEVDLAQLRVALKSVLGDYNSRRSNNGNNASFDNGIFSSDLQFTVLKLAKRSNVPCLCLDACSSSGRSSSGAMIQVHHAVPIRIMKADEFANYLPPQIPLPDVQLDLPLQVPLRVLVEKLKQLSPTVHVHGKMTGELTLSIETDGASIETFVSKLGPHYSDCKDPENKQASTTVLVDTKKLWSSLFWQNQSIALSSFLCLVQNEMLIVHVNIGDDGFFTYYVPVHYMSEQE